MGNAVSADELARAKLLQQQFAELERTARVLSMSAQAPPRALLAHQLLIDDAVISTRAGVRVLLGPVVGRVGFASARVLLEVEQDALVTCHVCVRSMLSDAMQELPQCRLDVGCRAGKPAVFHIKRLLPGRNYAITFGGIDKKDTVARRGAFRTPSLEASSSVVRAVVASGNNLYNMERCEANLWRDVRQAVEEEKAQLVLHLGGQVVMERMFDQSCTLLMRHASVISRSPNWSEIEASALEIMRSAYRTQWSAMSDLQFVLSHVSNLMIWSDMDVYPAFTTRKEFYIDHEKPTIQMQVMRTVTRCARRLYHEYQRQLWDDHIDELYLREEELHAVAEKALVSTAQIYQLSLQIPLARSDLELQKSRRDIEGARRVEKHLRSLESEKLKLESQLVSYNQLLAPQRGEEFVFCIGDVGFLFLDLRSTRLEPGGSQAADNDLMSNLQWEFIEKNLASDKIRCWIVCSELPVVDERAEVLANAAHATVPDLKSWWGRSPASQTRLLELLFDWKLEQSDRDFVLLSGASGVRFGGKATVKDIKLRTKAEQHIVGAITASPSGNIELDYTMRKPWLIGERFEVEHREITKKKMFATLHVSASSPETKDGKASLAAADIQLMHIGAHHHANERARVLLGPVVGFVDASSAVILLEIDRSFDVICIITNPLTGEMRKMYQHFEHKTPNSFYLTHLRPEHYYQIRFANIQDADHFQASFSTPARFPTRFELVALCNDDLVSTAHRESRIGDEQGATVLWDAVADKVVNVPFSSVNLTVHLGGQFCPDTNVFVDEALALADASCSLGIADDALVVEKLREMYRFSWNSPGVRETLSHGAHLILSSRRDMLALTDSSASEIHVCSLARQVHQEYHDLLLPPSKRVHLRNAGAASERGTRRALSHMFGAIGIFVLPIGDLGGVTVDQGSWDDLDAFLASPGLAVLLLVTEEAVVDHSFEDVLEKARFDEAYTCKFGFYRQELLKLLELLFEWKRSLSRDQPSQVVREVVFVSGSSYHSFDSVIQEVPLSSELLSHPNGTPQISEHVRSSQVILQYIVGPMNLAHSFSSPSSAALELAMLNKGTFSNKYSYHHFVAKRASPQVEKQDGEEASTETSVASMGIREQGRLGDNDAVIRSQIAHLTLSLGDAQDHPQVDATPADPTRAVSIWSLICLDEVESSQPDTSLDETIDVVYHRERRIKTHQVRSAANAWKLASARPSWLEKILSDDLDEDESTREASLHQTFQGKTETIRDAFEQVAVLRSGLVTLREARSFVPPLAESFALFYAASGSEFRTSTGSVPSPFVITYTVEQLRRREGDSLYPSHESVDLALYQLLLEKCVVNEMIFQRRLEKYWA